MMIVGYHPLEAYIQLFKGAFVGKVNLGTTLQKFVPILLTGVGSVSYTHLQRQKVPGSHISSLYMVGNHSVDRRTIGCQVHLDNRDIQGKNQFNVV